MQSAYTNSDNQAQTYSYLKLGQTVWRRLGSLCTEIFAMGLHREPKSPENQPRFLLESRRRTFAAAYRIDKGISTFVGRPPRLCLKYCDYRLPLDLSDDQLMEEGASFDLALASLDESGWSIDRTTRPSAWIRLRYIMATFREEILEMSLGTSQSITQERTEYVSTAPNSPQHFTNTLKIVGTYPTAVKTLGNHSHRSSTMTPNVGPQGSPQTPVSCN